MAACPTSLLFLEAFVICARQGSIRTKSCNVLSGSSASQEGEGQRWMSGFYVSGLRCRRSVAPLTPGRARGLLPGGPSPALGRCLPSGPASRASPSRRATALQAGPCSVALLLSLWGGGGEGGGVFWGSGVSRWKELWSSLLCLPVGHMPRWGADQEPAGARHMAGGRVQNSWARA